MGNLSLSDIKVYRNVYIIGYRTVPYQKFTGRTVLMYTGKVITTNSIPAEYDKTKDLLIDCECHFPKWGSLKRIFK